MEGTSVSQLVPTQKNQLFSPANLCTVLALGAKLMIIFFVIFSLADLNSLVGTFSCDSRLLESRGVGHSCILFPPNCKPSSMPPSSTAELIMIQCFGRYPVGTKAVLQRFAPIPRLLRGDQIIRNVSVEEYWELHECGSTGWKRLGVTNAQQGVQVRDYHLVTLAYEPFCIQFVLFLCRC